MTEQQPVDLCIPSLTLPLQMYVHGLEDKHVSRKIRDEGIWEPYETSLVLSSLKPGGVFVDVGANIGYFTLLAASAVGEQGQVFSFEPDPANFDLLLQNCVHNSLQSRVHAVKAGLSHETGAGQLYLSEDNLGDHQIYASDDRRQLDIKLLNGGDYLSGELSRNNLTGIDLIKVDTQGSEYQVMAGMLSLLQALPSVPSIIIELTPLSLQRSGASGRKLIELLATLEQDFRRAGCQALLHSPPGHT